MSCGSCTHFICGQLCCEIHNFAGFFLQFCRHLCVHSMFEQRVDCVELLCGLSFQEPLEQIRIIGYLMWRHVIVGVPPGDTSAVTRLPFILNKYL